MTQITLTGEIQSITVERGEDGTGVVLTIDTQHDRVVKVGRTWSDAEELTSMLAKAHAAAKEISDTGWPDDGDGFIGRYESGVWYVTLEGVQVAQNLDSRALAVLTLAVAMTTTGAFPSAWERDEWGQGGDPIDDEIRALHDAGGTEMLPYVYDQPELDDGTDIQVETRFQTGPNRWEPEWRDATVIRDFGQHGVAYQWSYDEARNPLVRLAARSEVRLAGDDAETTAAKDDDR